MQDPTSPLPIPAAPAATAGADAVLPDSSASPSLTPDSSSIDGGSNPHAPLEQAVVALAKEIVGITARLDNHRDANNAANDAIQVLSHRLSAVQSTLAELDTPANNAALEVILQSVAKPGVRSTEFWLNLLTAVGTLALAFSGDLSGASAAWITLGAATLHTLSRLSLKGKAADVANKSIR